MPSARPASGLGREQLVQCRRNNGVPDPVAGRSERKPMLHLATVKYDVVNCSGGAPCDHTTKLGPRQWNFPTLGFSTFGSATTYGRALVLGRPSGVLPRSAVQAPGERGRGHSCRYPPVGSRCSRRSPSCATGLSAAPTTALPRAVSARSAACPAATCTGPASSALDMTAMDVNNDGCVELPFVADPTTLTPQPEL